MKRVKLKSIQAWGVYSVWRRHAKVYQRTWLVNCLPPLSEPLIYLLAFGYGLTPLIGDVIYYGQAVSYRQFIAPAMIAVAVLFQAFFEGAYGSFIRLNYQKTWQALLTAPLTFTDVFLGDWLWAATKGMIAGSLTGVVSVLLGLYSGWHLLLSVPLMVMGSLLFGVMGLFTAGCVRRIDHLNIPIFLFIIPMFTLCGTYFPRDTLPTVLRAIATLLPLSALIDLLRWPLGLPPLWWLGLLWLAVLIVVFTKLAVRQIYPQLVQ